MLKMLILLALAGLMSSAWASLNLHDGPLFPPETELAIEVFTTTVPKKVVCYSTTGLVTQCRRKRGMEEKPEFIESHDDLEIAPSAVLRIQPTAMPRSMHRLFPDRVSGSFDDTYIKSQNIFRQIAAKGYSNKVVVGDCGKSTVNLSEFLSCLGMTVQETTTLTATFTETVTDSSSHAYTIMTIAGCLPTRFPYATCTDSPTTSTITLPDTSIVIGSQIYGVGTTNHSSGETSTSTTGETSTSTTGETSTSTTGETSTSTTGETSTSTTGETSTSTTEGLSSTTTTASSSSVTPP